MKILFFIESLRSGGKERRLIELLVFLREQTDFELQLVLTEDKIDYSYVKDLGIPIHIIKRKFLKKDPSLFFRFYRIAKKFKPDIIHTWGTMSTFYAIPTKLVLNKPLIANLIANSEKTHNKFSLSGFFHGFDYYYSDKILGNSNSGFEAYGLLQNPKIKLIYNGVRLERFDMKVDKQVIKKELSINEKYIIIMVASANKNKDYDLLLDVAKELVNEREDVRFLGVGGGTELERLNKRIKDENIYNINLLGRRTDVESLVFVSDIGVLFSPCEGLSNSIIESMALSKPVITTDRKGGSKELIEEGKSGFIMNRDVREIKEKLILLLDNENLRTELGKKGRQIIEERFTIEKMGNDYLDVYKYISHN